MKSSPLARVLALLLVAPAVHADTTPHVLANGDFSQDWSDAGLITANDDWSGVPSIVGFRGDNLTAANDVDPQTVLAADDPGVIDAIANQTNPNTQTAGGVAEFAITDPVVAMQGSGTADAPYLKLHLDTSGRQGVQVSYRLRDVDGSTDNAAQQVALHFRVGATGAWTNVPAAYVADATTGPSLATQETNVSVTLPAAVDNQPEVQVRIMTTNATGNDEWVGIDDIVVTSAALPVPVLSIGDVSLVEGDAGTTAFVFTLSLDAPMPAGTSCDFRVETIEGTATSGVDYQFLDQAVTIAAGDQQATASVLVNGDTDIETDETFELSAYGEPSECDIIKVANGVGTILNDDTAPIEVSIGSAAITEGNAGTTSLQLPVTLSAPAPAEVVIPFTVSAQTATAGVDYQSTSGNIVIASGASAGNAVVVVVADLLDENDETLGVTLGALPVGFTLGAGEATGTILDDDLPPSLAVTSPSINEGNAGTSPLVFTVSLSAPSGLDVSFTRATADGTATAGSDYVALAAATATIPAGSTSLDIAVQVVGDPMIEPAETFSLVLSSIANASPGSASATGTIVNDDVAGPPPALIPTNDPRGLALLALLCSLLGVAVLRRRG